MTEQLGPEGGGEISGEMSEDFRASQKEIISDLEKSELSEDEILEALHEIGRQAWIGWLPLIDRENREEKNLSDEVRKDLANIRGKIIFGAAAEDKEDKKKIINYAVENFRSIGIEGNRFSPEEIEVVIKTLREQGNEGFGTLVSNYKQGRQKDQEILDMDDLLDQSRDE